MSTIVVPMKMNVTNSSFIYTTETETICEYIAAIGGGCFYFFIFIWMPLSIKWNRFCPKSENCKVLFLVGSAVMLLHIFTNDKYEDIFVLKVKLGFEISVNITIGIITLCFMAPWIFKELPSLKHNEKCENPCADEQHMDGNAYKIKQLLPSMRFVGIVTFFIITMETVFLATTSRHSHPMKNLILGAKSVYLVEKILQATIYWLLCERGCVTQDKVNQAQFYFKVMAFYNGVIWLDSMVNTTNELILADVKDTGPPWVNIVGTLYKACIIDYRMMFCLVFMEHALTLTNQEEVEEQNNLTNRRKSGFKNWINCMTVGHFLGGFCIFLQLCCIANFIKEIDPGAWIHLFTIIAEFIIVICCFMLVRNLAASSRCEERRERSDIERPHGLKIVLCCFGAVGFAYWFYAVVLVISWASWAKNGHDDDYLKWLAPKLFCRGATALFLIYTFQRTTAEDMTTDAFVRCKCNFFLVGCLALGTLSEFLGAALDQYLGPIQERYKKEVTETSFKILLEVGPALYLAFCVHASLHFISIKKEMKTKIKTASPEASEASPLINT